MEGMPMTSDTSCVSQPNAKYLLVKYTKLLIPIHMVFCLPVECDALSFSQILNTTPLANNVGVSEVSQNHLTAGSFVMLFIIFLLVFALTIGTVLDISSKHISEDVEVIDFSRENQQIEGDKRLIFKILLCFQSKDLDRL